MGVIDEVKAKIAAGTANDSDYWFMAGQLATTYVIAVVSVEGGGYVGRSLTFTLHMAPLPTRVSALTEAERVLASLIVERLQRGQEVPGPGAESHECLRFLCLD